MAQSILHFLNDTLRGFDYNLIKVISSWHCGFLTFIFKAITFLGEKGIIF